jgi:hypothetical protein
MRDQLSDARSAAATADSAAAIAKAEQDRLILANQQLASAASEQAQASKAAVEVAAEGARQQSEEFRLVQRPIIARDDNYPGYQPGLGTDTISHVLHWNYAAQNVGKSSAYNVCLIESISIANKPFEHVSRPCGAEWTPGYAVFSSVYSHDVVTTELMSSINAVETGVVATVKITYNDFGGTKYTNYLCFSFHAKSAMGYCNYADVHRAIPFELGASDRQESQENDTHHRAGAHSD